MIGQKNLPQREFVKVRKLAGQKRSLRQTLMVLLKKMLMETEYIKEDMLLLKGGAYYSGDGINRAHITPDNMAKVLEESKNDGK